MTPSLANDKYLLTKILQNQRKMQQVIKDFNCTFYNLENFEYAFDLCALYMIQIGEASKSLSKDTKELFEIFDCDTTKYFRNMIAHVYERLDRPMLKAYIFQIISDKAINEIKQGIKNCDMELAKDKNAEDIDR